MEAFNRHDGDCDLSTDLPPEIRELVSEDDELEAEDILYALDIGRFLANCGTVACAVGHGPAAGIPLAKANIKTRRRKGVDVVTEIDFEAYSKNFVPGFLSYAFDWLFGGEWTGVDNHHWGAAARIRFYLDKNGVPADDPNFPNDMIYIDQYASEEEAAAIRAIYQPYRKVAA
jgi:hypothetical protein